MTNKINRNINLEIEAAKELIRKSRENVSSRLEHILRCYMTREGIEQTKENLDKNFSYAVSTFSVDVQRVLYRGSPLFDVDWVECEIRGVTDDAEEFLKVLK